LPAGLVGIRQLVLGHADLTRVLPRAPLRPFARLDRAHEPLRLLLEELAALVEPVAGTPLRLCRELLRLAGELAALLGEQVARLAPRLRGHEERPGRAEGGAEEEPAEVRRGIGTIVSHRCFLPAFGSCGETRSAPSGSRWRHRCPARPA